MIPKSGNQERGHDSLRVFEIGVAELVTQSMRPLGSIRERTVAE